MLKLFRKKTLICLILVTVLLGSAQVYAATTYHTDIFNLVKNGYIVLKDYFGAVANQEVNELKATSTMQMKEYVDAAKNESILRLEEYKDQEVARANKEIEEFIGELKNQVVDNVDLHEEEVKQLISDQVNHDIERLKKELQNELTMYMNDIFLY